MLNGRERCRNRNHGLLNAPIRFCPDCGQIVNLDIVPMRQCAEMMHLMNRRRGRNYCSDCGGRLTECMT